ncbi:GW dipeptide domain-containing protein [Lentibacillus sediminis]|uniref:GW dipeptide domain-containing protein n=1 Tax=Lentibacillus sediminis TaxID=1940529 RepID=UPI000C1C570C|nr:N-acetylglucosaminidase [Lentibacillus sediminis]
MKRIILMFVVLLTFSVFPSYNSYVGAESEKVSDLPEKELTETNKEDTYESPDKDVGSKESEKPFGNSDGTESDTEDSREINKEDSQVEGENASKESKEVSDDQQEKNEAVKSTQNESEEIKVEAEEEKNADKEDHAASVEKSEAAKKSAEDKSELEQESRQFQTFSISSVEVEESPTSKLGHTRSANVEIYKDLNNLSESFRAGDEYTHAVYYIKKQATRDGERYYLLSTMPSSTNGIVGWARATDLSTHPHTGIDSDSKVFYIEGTGNAYSKAWGGSKDLIYDLSNYENEIFNVHLTERVGSNVWYRGTLNGETLWIHNSYLSDVSENPKESGTSKLGHIRSTDVNIYENIYDLSNYFKAGEKYTNAVYYIKRQAVVSGQMYYLLSTKPSSTSGIVGWAKASDLSTHPHVGVDSKAKVFYFKGTGSAYTTAWGGSKDLVYEDMSSFAGEAFNVHLTETVGNNTWYRGNFNGKTIWLHSSYVTSVQEQSTSKLGHIRSSNVDVYEDLHDLTSSFKAGTEYTNAVYYIKKQAKLNGTTYYLLSKQPSSTSGVVGWAEASDLSTHPHVGVDSKAKVFYFKGTGSAYSKAWGGAKDLVYDDMSSFAGQAFHVHLTETVGSNTWYRGDFNGNTIWLHSSYVTAVKEQPTSKLGHIRNKNVDIYEGLNDPTSSFKAGTEYTNAVYYIKKQAKKSGTTYYLLSTKPSSAKGVVGWAKASDLSTNPHVGVDSEAKTLYIQGSGSAYAKAWGGSKDLVYEDLSQFEGKEFEVNLTEKVGSNTWYRGTLNGKTSWIHESYLAEVSMIQTTYNLSLAEALAIQMAAAPQTDKEYDTYVSKTWVNNQNEITANILNVRGGPGTNYWVVGQLTEGDTVNIIREVNGWYQIEYTENRTWVNASPDDVLHYLDPTNFANDESQRFQFLDLARPSGSTAAVLNTYLEGKGILEGKGQAFIEASIENGVSDLYLMSHAILETGHGTSELAQGVNHNGVTVYNMFGIGANDGCAVECGAARAYDEGWTTPEKAIIGGARFIGNSYIKAGQNTLYEMRWNPEAMAAGGIAAHQYATDIGWASKQIYTMYDLYQQLGLYNINLDIPVYRKF